jgi:hypothetical protein
LEIRPGFGALGIGLAQRGAQMTFVDLVQTNLEVLKRICAAQGVAAEFCVLQDHNSLRPLDLDYDVVMAVGSLHNAPQKVMQPEYQELVRHLRLGGRWWQLAYPQIRWIRDGRPRFDKWGPMVDGPGTPWEEWYDVPKLLSVLAPATFELLLYEEWLDGTYNWFDLICRD